MRFWIPFDSADRAPIGVSVEGKSYKVFKDDKSNGRPVVEIDAQLLPQTIGHLVTLGWKFADERTANTARDSAGVKLGPDGQPIVDETLSKNQGKQA